MTYSAPPIRVLIAHNNFIMREGIRSVISRSDGIVMAGEACNVSQALPRFRALMPDVTVIDIQLSDVRGIHALESIRRESPCATIIALSSKAQAIEALKAGAQSYVLNSAHSSELIKKIRYMHQRYCRKGVMTNREILASPVFEVLTEREVAIIQAVAGGNSNRDVAKKLLIGLETVKAHLKHISAKLGTRDRAHAVATAIKLGFIDP